MPDSGPPSPDTTAATGDPGDDTGRRYRYQWTYAAIACCALLDDTRDVVEVFCEQHEDVLLKHADSSFTGLQVKTRSNTQPVWKSNAAAVITSCVRFAKLEHTFPGRFKAFRFLTNHPLHSAGNSQDFCYVLASIRAAAELAAVPKAILTFLRRIAKDAGCSLDVAFVALGKTEAHSSLPQLTDIESRLAATLIFTWPLAASCSYDSLLRAARALILECERASTLAHADLLPAYIPAVSTGDNIELAARIVGKQISKARLLAVLDMGLADMAPLEGDLALCAHPGTGASALLMHKLDVGGFSAVSVNSATDLRDKADYLGLVWTNKFGRRPGLQRYTHVRSLVLKDAATAFETAKRDDRTFGLNMLSQLRTLFRERRRDGSQLYDCTDEHLEGLVYSLTSECKVYWSLDRPWEKP